MRRWCCSLRVCLFVAGLTLAGSTRASGGNAPRRISPTCCRRGGSGPTAVCLDWSIHCGCRRLSLYFFQLWVGGLSGKFFDVEVFRNRCSFSARGRARSVAVSVYNKSRCRRPGCLTGRRRLPDVMLPPRRTSPGPHARTIQST